MHTTTGRLCSSRFVHRQPTALTSRVGSGSPGDCELTSSFRATRFVCGFTSAVPSPSSTKLPAHLREASHERPQQNADRMQPCSANGHALVANPLAKRTRAQLGHAPLARIDGGRHGRLLHIKAGGREAQREESPGQSVVPGC